MKRFTPLNTLAAQEEISTSGVVVCLEQKGMEADPDIDVTFPYIILSLTLSGKAYCLYDMKDMRSQKNDLVVFLPGHIIRSLEYSADYRQTWLIFNPARFVDSERKFTPQEFETLYTSPICHLTDVFLCQQL